MKKHTLLAGLGVAASVALVATGCSGSGGSDDGSTKVTFLTHWGPEQVTMLEDAAAAFTEENPDITVEVQAVPFANLLSTLRTQGASADGPTIAGIYDAWLPELARDGLAAEAPSDVAKDVTDNWPSGVVNAATQEGALYGIPNEVDLYQLNYNTALFEEAGIAAPPATWDELLTAADAITATGDGRQGIGFITSWNSGAVHPFLSLLASNGGSFLNEAGDAADLESPEALETAELYQQLVDAGATNPAMSGANANTTGPYLDNFVNGKTGMIIMANWWESSLKDAMGDDFANVATAPIPVGPSGDVSSSISYSWDTIVNGNASDEKQAAAWKFLSWLNGPDSGENGSSAMGDMLISMGILPSRLSDVEAHAEALGSDFLSSYVAAMETATPFPTVLGASAGADALQRQIEALLNGQVDAATAMKTATADVDAALTAAR
ncbi:MULTISPECIES: ABC transporter substrate-binding protein [Microbacterium]|uniref:ABC transporter substrate-binding protein n=1 Tax=Microbacterium TaxID=33882 RepID=UPI001EF47E72|nr:sugar ABC transporter substrate-binding protein [Microbacterium sp. ACRRU]MCG7418561.1 sugar ABC transporter substrate-binding protein [Microbacterium sp. ACRRU]